MPFINRGKILARMAALLMLGAAGTGCQSNPIFRGYTPDGPPAGVPAQAVPVTTWLGQDPPPADPGVRPVAAFEPALGPPAINTAAATAPPQVPAHAVPMPAQPPAYAAAPTPAGRPGASRVRSGGVTFFPTPPGQKSLVAKWFDGTTTKEPPRLAPQPAPANPSAPCQGAGCSSAVMLRPIPVADAGAPPAVRIGGEAGIVSSDSPVARITAPESQPVSFVPAARPGDVPGGLPAVNTAEAAPPPKVDNPPPKSESLPPPRMGHANNNGKNGGLLPMPRLAKDKHLEGFPELPAPTVTHPPSAPREFAKRALSDYIIEPPDVLQIDLSTAVGDKNFPVRGTHLVRPDGTVGLGPYGAVFVAGLTIEQAKLKVADRITHALFEEKDYYKKLKDVLQALKVDVTAYNSKFYYIIADGGGYGEQVYRVLCTGNETILDAIAQVEGLPRVASKSKIWIARATPTEVHQPNILPVDWVAVTQLGSAATNYQIYPGDRIYVNSDVRIRIDSQLAKIISPIERLFGITLLGSTTVNSFRRNQGNQ